MELLLALLTALGLVIVLYILNKVFNFKNRLVSPFGVKKYNIALLVLAIIIGCIQIWKYDINVFKNPIGLSVIYSYAYLVNIR